MPQPQRNHRQNERAEQMQMATAAYNFISLPDKPLSSPLEKSHNALLEKDQKTSQAEYKNYILENCPLSGEIQLELEALTAFFIGGNHDNKSKTFSPIEDSIVIPGSSLRGMIKNIFKIVTLSTFRGKTSTQVRGYDITDRHIYYRCLVSSGNSPAWTKTLNALYNKRMTEEKMDNQNHKYIVRKAKPGFLIKSRGRYYIAPCNREERILIKNYQDAYNDIIRFRDSRVTWHGSKAYIITGQPSSNLKNSKEYEKIKNNIVELKKAGKQHIRFVDLQSMCWERNQWIEVPDEVLNEYRHDKTRKGLYLLANRRNSSNRIDGCLNRNDLQRLDIYSEHSYIIDKIIDTLIPCHYLIEDKRLTAFGHGQCFRIPYQNSISDGIPKALNSDIIDFTDAVFGRERYWASKIFIEDAKPETTIETFDVLPSKPLMNPNPTSYQLYLTQKQNGELIHYDTLEMRLRGYKNYWHNKAIPDWIVRDEDAINLDKSKPEDKRLIRYIAPVKKGCKFKSKIRFKNLSPLELGALLTVFDLSGNGKTCAYKLGAGKPWGFGSFKIKAQLFLDDEKKDYTKLFNDDNTFYNPAQQITNIDTYLETFAEYIKNQGMENSWMHIMGELCDILEWDGIGKGQRKNWQNKIKSMSGNVMRNTNTGRNSVDERFIQRAPLPTIAEVLKQ